MSQQIGSAGRNKRGRRSATSDGLRKLKGVSNGLFYTSVISKCQVISEPPSSSRVCCPTCPERLRSDFNRLLRACCEMCVPVGWPLAAPSGSGNSPVHGSGGRYGHGPRPSRMLSQLDSRERSKIRRHFGPHYIRFSTLLEFAEGWKTILLTHLCDGLQYAGPAPWDTLIGRPCSNVIL
jgi:hypothetical protein